MLFHRIPDGAPSISVICSKSENTHVGRSEYTWMLRSDTHVSGIQIMKSPLPLGGDGGREGRLRPFGLKSPDAEILPVFCLRTALLYCTLETDRRGRHCSISESSFA